MKTVKSYLPVLMAVLKELGFPERRTRQIVAEKDIYIYNVWSCENTVLGNMEQTIITAFLEKFNDDNYVSVRLTVYRTLTSINEKGEKVDNEHIYYSPEFKRLTKTELLEDIQTWLKENHLNMSYWAA